MHKTTYLWRVLRTDNHTREEPSYYMADDAYDVVWHLAQLIRQEDKHRIGIAYGDDTILELDSDDDMTMYEKEPDKGYYENKPLVLWQIIYEGMIAYDNPIRGIPFLEPVSEDERRKRAQSLGDSLGALPSCSIDDKD